MNDFKYRHFQSQIILHCVRWYCKYGISYRDLEEMMEERGVKVDHTTLYRQVQRYATELEKRMRWYKRFSFGSSWRVDETYIKVKGVWKYLYRAVDKQGRTITFIFHIPEIRKQQSGFCKNQYVAFLAGNNPM